MKTCLDAAFENERNTGTGVRPMENWSLNRWSGAGANGVKREAETAEFL